MRAHGVSPDMTTGQFCERVIKPSMQDRQCVFLDLFVDAAGDLVSPGLLGPPVAFVSQMGLPDPRCRRL